MNESPLLRLRSFGQSPWLDYLSRGLLNSGQLVRLIREDGLGGVTSNPAIFHKAMGENADYDGDIKKLARLGKTAAEIYDELLADDVQLAADFLRPLYDRMDRRDGFVSLEVAPHLAYDTAGTILEARRLWRRVDRPNLMIKVPGTWEGIPAFRQLIAEGINVNVTLLFGLPRYLAVSEAYLDGLTERAGKGLPLEGIASVASFFLSRIDVLVDPLLDKLSAEQGTKGEVAAALKGGVAIACAKVAYALEREIVAGERFRVLAGRGARSQRLLWASTGTKNPAYPDLKYVEPLIGPDTVNTMPLETLTAYRDHGDPAPRLDQGLPGARKVLERLSELGIDLNQVTQQLEEEGIDKFVKPFDSLMQTLERKLVAARG